MVWSKYNNPNRRKRKKNISRNEADIIVAKNMFDDKCKGIDLPLSFYDKQSDIMCNKQSRNIY